ncbi:class I SAM-dependent methyltransferase [Oceanitalea stevensii]|uniref:Class I SAM-dependent methyltransferase n=1 Tax=Oceanitalea stevensii TaxID=2763072 RepID=A0ABR8Z453_9MICO|nr:class I SAM-dependent methyltransferase [Oceanitalea stevensii]MBD8063102.1 class I SAM-dependent methyltransferase [Oceanitalea stevensii]
MALATPRQRALAALVALLVVLTGLAALTGRTGWALAGLAVLLGYVAGLLLDLRHRQQVAARSQRRLEGTVEQAVSSVAGLHHLLEQHGAGLTALDDGLRALVREEAEAAAGRHRETTHRLSRLDYEPVNEVQALLQLLPKVQGAVPLPPVGGWALSAGSLLGLWDVVERERPRTVVECGSGTSTVWLGYAARAVGGVRVVALEHNAAYAERTHALLGEHGLLDVAEVRHAPLVDVEVDGATMRWYDAGRLEDVSSIDLLVVDGPPKSTGPLARLPAVPLLRERLRPGAVVVMDDAHRPDEREALRRWSLSDGLELERPLSRDAVVLRRTSPSA